jgi:hypothetical protein
MNIATSRRNAPFTLKGRKPGSFPFRGKVGMGVGFVMQDRDGVNSERPDK